MPPPYDFLRFATARISIGPRRRRSFADSFVSTDITGFVALLPGESPNSNSSSLPRRLDVICASTVVAVARSSQCRSAPVAAHSAGRLQSAPVAPVHHRCTRCTLSISLARHSTTRHSRYSYSRSHLHLHPPGPPGSRLVKFPRGVKKMLFYLQGQKMGSSSVSSRPSRPRADWRVGMLAQPQSPSALPSFHPIEHDDVEKRKGDGCVDSPGRGSRRM